MKNVDWVLTGGVLFSVLVTTSAAEPAAPEYRVAETLDIDHVPSWFPVGFCLLTHDENQYVAYYNQQHQMMLAHRRLGEREFEKSALPSKVGWDSHNYVTMAVDADGHIHLSGNMHCVPLIYFRTRNPRDITTFVRHKMTGQEETRCTYPRFLMGADGTLLFTYRSGGSGNGRRLYNRYDSGTKTWARFLDTPLFEGEGKRNAYPLGPIQGPDGLFHVVWVWRDTPDCATNHDLSYARSRDLKSWESASGRPVRLPLTLDQTSLCVDPVPSGGGIINGCERLAFDSRNRPIIAYHKADEKGHMQVYVARWHKRNWQRSAITSWDKEISFGGRGAMPFIGIRLGELKAHAEGVFSMSYRHRDLGSGRIAFDGETLRPVKRELVIRAELPSVLRKPTHRFDGIRVKMANDLGESNRVDRKYLLRWETLEAHHDRPRQPPLPPASVLQLIELKRVK